jgi:hypothetical protein
MSCEVPSPERLENDILADEEEECNLRHCRSRWRSPRSFDCIQKQTLVVRVVVPLPWYYNFSARQRNRFFTRSVAAGGVLYTGLLSWKWMHIRVECGQELDRVWYCPLLGGYAHQYRGHNESHAHDERHVLLPSHRP